MLESWNLLIIGPSNTYSLDFSAITHVSNVMQELLMIQPISGLKHMRIKMKAPY